MENDHLNSCACNDCLEKDFSQSIQWNSEPLLANPLTFWRDWWNADTWIKWHSLVKGKYGKDRANEVLLIWWNKAPFASPTIDFRTFNDKFVSYAKENGFYDALFSGILGQTVGKTATLGKKTVEATGKVIDTAGDIVEKTGEIVSFTGRNLKIIILVVALLIIGFMVYKFKGNF